MADRSISFTISLKDAVSKAALKAGTSIKEMQGAFENAVHAVAKAESDAKALADANLALARSQKEVASAAAKAAPENMLLGKSLSDIIKADEQLQNVQKQHEEVQRAQTKAQNEAIESARKAQADIDRLTKSIFDAKQETKDNGSEMLSFAKVLKGEVSKAALKAGTDMKSFSADIQKAYKAIEEAERKAKALEMAERALAKQEQEITKARAAAGRENIALGKSEAEVLKAQKELKRLLQDNRILLKAYDKVKQESAEAEEEAKKEVEALTKAMEKQKAVTDESGGKVKTFGRVLDQLAQGNIRGAIAALGSFGKAFIGLSGVATGAYAVFRMVKGAIDGIRERAHAARMEELQRGFENVSKAAAETERSLNEIITRFDRLKARSKEKIELQVSVFNTARNAARAQSEADYQKSIAGLTDPELIAEKAAQNQRNSLFSQSNAVSRDFSLQRKMLTEEDKNLKMQIATMRENAGQYARDIEAARKQYWAALGTEKQEEMSKRLDELFDKADEEQRKIIALEDRRRAIAEELTRSKKEEATAQKEIEAQAQALKNADEARAKAAEAAAKAKEREAKLRDQGFENSFGMMKDQALLKGVMAKPDDIRGQINAQNDVLENAAEWAVKPFEQAEAAAKEAVSEWEEVVESLKKAAETATGDQRVEAVNRLIEAEKKLDAFREEAANAEKVRVNEVAKAAIQLEEQKRNIVQNANQNARAERDRLQNQLDAKREENQDRIKAEALSQGVTPAERRAAKRRAKAEAKAIRRYKNRLSMAEQAFERNGGNKLFNDGDISSFVDEEGNIKAERGKGITGEQYDSLKRLTKADRARLAAEAKRKQEEKDLEDKIKAQNKLMEETAKNTEELNNKIAAMTQNLDSVMNALVDISKIDMGAGETPSAGVIR